MTKKEIADFDTFREHCQNGEKSILLGKDFVAIDRKSFGSHTTIAHSIDMITKSFNLVKDAMFEEKNKQEIEKIKMLILDRYIDLLSK